MGAAASEALPLTTSCEWWQGGVDSGCESQAMFAGGGGGCVLGVPVGSLWRGAVFGVDPVFLGQTQNSVLFRLFPNISITLEQIYVFQTSGTDYTHKHTHKSRK